MSSMDISQEDVDRLYRQLDNDAKSGGYHLNPDTEMTRELIKGLLVNEKRYGYQACPCRLASGTREEDLDIVCPCDYRDPDLDEYDACYCSLYVSQDIVDSRKQPVAIPERRPSRSERMKTAEKPAVISGPLPMPVWRCRVCGYLCARDGPPEVCPICKAKKERFERFM